MRLQNLFEIDTFFKKIVLIQVIRIEKFQW